MRAVPGECGPKAGGVWGVQIGWDEKGYHIYGVKPSPAMPGSYNLTSHALCLPCSLAPRQSPQCPRPGWGHSPAPQPGHHGHPGDTAGLISLGCQRPAGPAATLADEVGGQEDEVQAQTHCDHQGEEQQRLEGYGGKSEVSHGKWEATNPRAGCGGLGPSLCSSIPHFSCSTLKCKARVVE